jgi:hypothetical protein
VARKALGAATDFGRHRDAWGYPVHENAYQKIALGKSPKERTMLEPKTAYAADPGSVPGLVNCRANTSVTGYFEAYFEDVALDTNVGYDDPNKGPARRTEACQVLQDIAALIKLDQTTVTPDILFAVNPGNLPAGALAAASAYSGYYGNGSDNGSLSKHIISRVDPTPGTGNFDAFVITNFNGVSWDVDSSLSANTYDFYTVIYHEVLHALGFRSLLPAVINTTNSSYQHTTFDLYTYKDSSLTDRFFNAVSEFLQVPVGAPSAWFINNSLVYRGIKNIPGAVPDSIRPVYSPFSWEQGSSLSHFDMSRSSGDVYVMHPSINTNTTRVIHAGEKEVLCHEGYQVAGVAGCELATPVAQDDFSPQGGAPCIALTQNDSSFTGGDLTVHRLIFSNVQIGDQISLFTDENCTVTASTTTITNTTTALSPIGVKSIKLLATGNSSPYRTMQYTVIDSISGRVSFPARITLLGSCSTDPNEYICNGNFEMGLSNTPIPTNNSFWHANHFFDCYPGMYQNYSYVAWWCRMSGSPDLVGKNLNNSLYHSLWHLPYTMTYSPGITIDMVDSGKFAAIMFDNSTDETITTQLRVPLTVGQQYVLSFDTRMVTTGSPYTLVGSGIIKADLYTQFSLSSTSQNIVSQQLPLNSTSWTHISQPFIAQQPFAYLSFHELPISGGSQTGSYVDNVSILPISPGTNTISGKVYLDQNANGSLNTNESGLHGVQVAIFTQNSSTPLQTVSTQNTPQLGDYTFTNIPNGTYNIVLVGENVYSQITEPVVNNPVLQNSYLHVKQVIISGGQTVSNENFGVVLVADLCPNLSGVQTTIPYGYQDVSGQCVQIDVCSNISGAQISVPAGYTATGTQCDACANISGVQSGVPSGYTNVNGQCIKNSTDTVSVTDLCPNLSGVQTTIPEGYSLVRGQCLKIMKSSTISTTDISKSVLDPFKTVLDPLIQSATR